ncbi:MAG: OmpA family protein [Vicinamibacterales bacterium]
MRRNGRTTTLQVVVMIAALVTVACAKKQGPVARVPPPPAPSASASGADPGRPPAPPEPVMEPTVVPAEPVLADESLDTRSLDDLNRDSPLEPLLFGYDSAEVSTDGRSVLNRNAEILKGHPSWVVTIEGHCDERGTAEYNLALGERRALAASAYLMSLGIDGTRLRTVSYGKEFPFDPARTEEAYAKNRRAHFVITSK